MADANGKTSPRVVVQVHGWYPIVVLVLVFVITSGLNVLYTNYVNSERQKADRRAAAIVAEQNRLQACQLAVAFDNLYRETAPGTPAGQKVAELWAEYRQRMAC